MARKEERKDAALEEYYPNAPESINDFISGAEWADKTLIDKACKWLSKHFYDKDYEIRDDEGCWIDADLMITDFRKEMED